MKAHLPSLLEQMRIHLSDKPHRDEAVCEAKCENRGAVRIARAKRSNPSLLSIDIERILDEHFNR